MCRVCLGLDCENFRYKYNVELMYTMMLKIEPNFMRPYNPCIVSDWCEKIKEYLNLDENNVIIKI